MDESRGRVLLVDDDPGIQRGVARGLGHAGYAVQTASDGRSAIELLHTGSFDAVLTDISMPNMDGIELLREVRAREPELPVVLITGNPTVDTAVRAIEHGVVRYLIKPFEIKQAIEVLDYAVRIRRLANVRRAAMALAEPAGVLDGRAFEEALAGVTMVFQPIVCWGQRRVAGYEALLRSSHASLSHAGLLLSAAERLGRVHDLGRCVRARVAAAIEPACDADVFVNLHSSDLLDAELSSKEAPLSRYADRVVLEITERASLDDVRDVKERIAQLRAMGYRIALDDLGAGYAGLSSFVLLQPDVVKIDMSLVRDVDADPARQKMISMMVQLCRELGTLVVVEGVETAGERIALTDLGCDLLQGFLFARPGPPFPAVTW